MQCRQCGTEIAEKALICYRCGTATTEAKFKPAGTAARSLGWSLYVIPLIVLALIVAVTWSGGFDVRRMVLWVVAAVIAVALAQSRLRRRG
jgi:hypothetical protein